MGTRVLTVEDDERIRASVRLALEDEGWTVDEAATGEDAVELFVANPADVVLIDSRVSTVNVVLHKPSAPIPFAFSDVCVKIERSQP